MHQVSTIKVGAVSYLNTKPMIEGLQNWNNISLSIDYPANIANMLLSGTIDVGLVPVAILPKMKEHHIIGTHGIAATGKVETVCIYSEVPLQDVTSIYLDYQSKSSVQLLQILLREYWQLHPTLLHANEGYEENIKGHTAGLVIGNRAFNLNQRFPHIYDLSEAWHKYTSLPFVFALWVANKPLPPQFIADFDNMISQNIATYHQNIGAYTLNEIEQNYLTNIIQYNITAAHQKGLELFLSKLV